MQDKKDKKALLYKDKMSLIDFLGDCNYSLFEVGNTIFLRIYIRIYMQPFGSLMRLTISIKRFMLVQNFYNKNILRSLIMKRILVVFSVILFTIFISLNNVYASGDVAGKYKAELSAASSPGRIMVLNLYSDNSAVLTSDYQNGKPPVVEEGSWKTSGKSVAISLDKMNGRKSYNPLDITFELMNSALVAVKYDEKVFGSDGLKLAKVEVTPAVNTTWKWVSTTYEKDKLDVTTPDDYTIELKDNGRILVKADCNRGFGKIDMNDYKLVVGEMSLTKVACPDGSLSAKFLNELSNATVYATEGDALMITLKDNSVMKFVK
jgi:heat shock protein HslJ